MGDLNRMDEFFESFKKLFISSEYSDLTVLCGSEVFKVHKNVVCPRAGFFARCERFGGKEAQSGTVTLEDDDPRMIKAMFEFLYTCDYTAVALDETLSMQEEAAEAGLGWTPPFGSVDDWDSDLEVYVPTVYGGEEPCNLVFHAALYAVADKFEVSSLKDLVKEKFKKECTTSWKTLEFSCALHEAYSSTLDTDKGLRDIIVETIASHMELLREPAVEASMMEFNGLAFGLLKAKFP